ncbi:hypothetical protein [Streptomyces sp. NPDC058371]|uniref:hypothetical protein n=1 Tax=Streptomyces sp. NPDC058371 TaxID=3346463 RepID=UPI003648939C
MKESAEAIGRAVQAVFAAPEGDVGVAMAALVKEAVPDAMGLFDDARRGGRYVVIALPWMRDLLRG